MTEARAALRAFAAVGEIERWIAAAAPGSDAGRHMARRSGG